MSTRSIGVVVTGHVAAGVVEDDRVVGEVRLRWDDDEGGDFLQATPAGELVDLLAAEVLLLATAAGRVEAIGFAFPGIIRAGVIEESPNLKQLKGLEIGAAMREALAKHGIEAKLSVSNDADAVAAGIAATHSSVGVARGQAQSLKDRLIRVWTLGAGIGFGRYPEAEGVWEGGHTVVSLDPQEKFCGCGGRGHLEGIMGHRAMRLRFMDREPEEVFAAARAGEDRRFVEFAELWHRALAAATATSIHLEGPGKFYITGANARFVNLAVLNRCVQEMVKLSPLLNYVFEIVPRSDEIAIIGATVNALSS